MDSNTMTVKQLADELKVSKTTIAKVIDELGIIPERRGNKCILSAVEVSAVKSQIANRKLKTQTSRSDADGEENRKSKSQTANLQGDPHGDAVSEEKRKPQTANLCQKTQTSRSDAIYEENRKPEVDVVTSVLGDELEILKTELGLLQEQLKAKDEQIARQDEKIARQDEHIDKQLETIQALTLTILSQRQLIDKSGQGSEVMDAVDVSEVPEDPEGEGSKGSSSEECAAVPKRRGPLGMLADAFKKAVHRP